MQMMQSASRDVAKKAVSEILKHVDQLIKSGNIEESMHEIIRAKEADPGNPYIHAYEERLAYLNEEHERNAAQEKTRKEAEEAARLRDEELQKRLEEERKRLSEEAKRKVEEQKEQAAQAKPIREQSEPAENENKKPEALHNSAREDAIHRALTNVLSSSTMNANQAVGTPLSENSVGQATDRRTGPEPGLAGGGRKENRAFDILLIDDDENMLSLIGQVLTDHGYSVTSLSTTDEAVILLKRWKPSLILCDVDLKTSTMGGFTFYEKIQELEGLHDIPFVFLTGLADEIIMNRGKELGVDDYLTKPVSEQTLISTVKGKLKRYESLRKGKK